MIISLTQATSSVGHHVAVFLSLFFPLFFFFPYAALSIIFGCMPVLSFFFFPVIFNNLSNDQIQVMKLLEWPEPAHLYLIFCIGTVTFSQVVIEVMRQLEGAYALIFKSPHYPNELIACTRGSTLILGVKVSD